jgi:hypothetical protein
MRPRICRSVGGRVQKGAESCGDGYGLVAPGYIMDGYAYSTSKADPGARGSSIRGGIFYVTTTMIGVDDVLVTSVLLL